MGVTYYLIETENGITDDFTEGFLGTKGKY